ncbi:2193_t:CDS:2 [Acaulospora morrowiae]|uniref:2193_t:CDS:1 n=1 Tax=Acaulospora morrowiae TaxID=94023 RepID=A0A9N9GQG3_9GLOM|nr:2193_t:CDS:2 [Acaulospora morrowiae]
MKVKQINQLSTGDGATYNDNRQGKHRRDVDDEEKKMSTEGATIPAKKCKTKSEKRTRSGRLIVPNYSGLLTGKTSSEKTTYTDENPSQENEEEATTEDSFENRSQGNDEKRTIQDNIITDILGNTELSDASKEIITIYKAKYPNGDLIDLRLKSPFLKELSRQIATSYLTEMDTMTETLVPANVHEFLVKFFSQELTTEEWNSQIDDLKAPEKDDFVMNAVVRVLRRTLPQFIKAFSLEEQNPLLNIATIEHSHLNAFVHPCLDASLWYIAGIHYEFGEITSKNHTNGNRADGVGYMTDADKYQLIYVEGSRPITKDKRKPMTQRLPKKLYVFGGQSFRLRIYLYFLDHCGTYRLNEIDNANLPRKFSEMKNFVYFYESVLKWSLLVRDVTASFDDARAEQRPSRLSYANALLQLD